METLRALIGCRISRLFGLVRGLMLRRKCRSGMREAWDRCRGRESPVSMWLWMGRSLWGPSPRRVSPMFLRWTRPASLSAKARPGSGGSAKWRRLQRVGITRCVRHRQDAPRMCQPSFPAASRLWRFPASWVNRLIRGPYFITVITATTREATSRDSTKERSCSTATACFGWS